jgi:hypothetical protein
VVTYPDYVAGQMGPPYAFETDALVGLYKTYQNEACVAANNASYCNVVTNLYPYINTTMFVGENEADSQQIFVELQAPQTNTSLVDGYVQYYVGQMKHSLMQIAGKPADALFAPGCLDHTEDIQVQSPVLVQGISYGSAFNAWWSGNNAGIPHIVMDECGHVPCNPTCMPQ